MKNNLITKALKALVPPQILWLPRYYILFKWVKFERQELVLDAACGEGLVTFKLNKKGVIAVGVDKSDRNIKTACKQRGDGTEPEFIVADIRELPFENNTFDKIVSLDTLEHISDDNGVFREFNRVLKPKGRLIATLPFTHCSSMKFFVEQCVLRKFIPRFLYSRSLYNGRHWLKANEDDVMKAHGHLRNYSMPLLEEKIANLFKIDRYECFFKRFTALATDITYGVGGLWHLRFIFFLIATRLDYFVQKNKKGYWFIIEFSKTQ